MLLTELKELITEQVQKGFKDSLGTAFKDSDAYKEWNQPVKNKLLTSFEDTKQFNTGSAKSYRALYGIGKDVELGDGGFDNLDEFLMAVNNSRTSPDNRLTKDMEELTGAAGGFLLPELFEAQLMDLNLMDEVVRPRAKTYGIPRAKGNSISIPAYEDVNHGESIAGVVTYWKPEKGTLTESTPTLRKISMKVNKLTVLSDSSNELIEDSAISISGMIGDLFKAAFSFEFDKVFMNGTGSGQPLGFRNGPAIITIAAEGEQDAATIVYENLVNMFARLPVNSYLKKNTIWISSVSNIPQLMKIGIKLGTAGVHIPIFKEVSGKYYILGKEVLFSEHCPVLGSQGNLLLCDLSQYAIAIKSGIRIESTIYDKFTTDMSTFRGIVRFDGQPLCNSAITLADSSTTVSPFIQLGDVA